MESSQSARQVFHRRALEHLKMAGAYIFKIGKKHVIRKMPFLEFQTENKILANFS